MNFDLMLNHHAIMELAQKKTGLLCNHTSWDIHSGSYLFQKIPGLVRIFLPEHGLFAELQDQIPLTDNEIYRDFGLSVETCSLYGDSESSLAADPGKLSDLEVLFIDLQDVGSRYYTFATTVSYIMEVITRHNIHIPIVIIDRENPAGLQIEGSILPKDFESFVGRPGLPHRHGLTLAELSLFYYKDLGCRFPLHIITLTDQKIRPDISDILPDAVSLITNDSDPEDQKNAFAEDLSRTNPVYSSILQSDNDINYVNTWMISPSPNMPGPVTPLVYSGQCLLEGTNLSEGRGTTRPFEIFGAPYLKPIGYLTDDKLFMNFPGAVLRPLRFLPVFHKWKDEVCEGFQIHLTAEPYHSLMHTLYILRTIREKYPEDFEWRHGAYEFRSDRPAIELLCGDPVLLDFINSEISFQDLREYFRNTEKNWIHHMNHYKIYDRKNYKISDI
jgi:uncharacterized protein YbbC (DUF1343 family)